MSRIHNQTSRGRIILFAVLLVSIFVLVILFAGGYLKFGLLPQFTYILYAIAGLFAAVTCYGLLSSLGTLTGSYHGFDLRLGGAIVAFVVVAGGGGIYEKYLHTAEYFDMRIFFYRENINRSEPISGDAVLFVGNAEKIVSLNNEGTCLFQQIPVSNLGQQIKIELRGNFQIEESVPIQSYSSDLVYVKVKPVNAFVSPESSVLVVSFDGGAVTDFGPQPDKKSVTLNFEVLSTSEKKVPLENRALLEVTNNNGTVAFSQNYKLENSLLINPNETRKVIVDILIPKDVLSRIDGHTATLTLFYDQRVEKTSKEFSQSFTFDTNRMN